MGGAFVILENTDIVTPRLCPAAMAAGSSHNESQVKSSPFYKQHGGKRTAHGTLRSMHRDDNYVSLSITDYVSQSQGPSEIDLDIDMTGKTKFKSNWEILCIAVQSSK